MGVNLNMVESMGHSPDVPMSNGDQETVVIATGVWTGDIFFTFKMKLLEQAFAHANSSLIPFDGWA